MEKLSCVKCGSENTQIVRGIYESGTEAKYKVDSEKVSTEKPTIGELLASDQRVTITNQSRLAERLGSIDLPVYSFTEFSYPLEDFMDFPEEYEELNRKNEELDRKIIDKQSELQERRERIKSLENKRPTPPRGKKEDILRVIGVLLIFFIILFAFTIFTLDILYLLVLFLFCGSVYKLIEAINPKIEVIKHQKASKKANKKNSEEIRQLIQTELKEVRKLVKEIPALQEDTITLLKNIQNIKIKAENARRKFNEKKEQEIMKRRERKIEFWSNLYYCHHCDTVMDFYSGKYQTPEKINDLVESLLD